MMRTLSIVASSVMVLSLAHSASADTILVDKIPTDTVVLEGYSPTPTGAFAFAGSFIFGGVSGTLMTVVGAYMQREGNGPAPGVGTPFAFQVFQDEIIPLSGGGFTFALPPSA